MLPSWERETRADIDTQIQNRSARLTHNDMRDGQNGRKWREWQKEEKKLYTPNSIANTNANCGSYALMLCSGTSTALTQPFTATKKMLILPLKKNSKQAIEWVQARVSGWTSEWMSGREWMKQSINRIVWRWWLMGKSIFSGCNLVKYM